MVHSKLIQSWIRIVRLTTYIMKHITKLSANVISSMKQSSTSSLCDNFKPYLDLNVSVLSSKSQSFDQTTAALSHYLVSNFFCHTNVFTFNKTNQF